MSLNNIRLNPSLATALYSHSLVESEKEEIILKNEPPASKTNPPGSGEQSPRPVTGIAFKCLGNNEKNVLIVVNYDNTLYLPDDELSFLTNILAACKLSLGDVAIVNMHHHPGMVANNLIEHFDSKTVLLFGIGPARFGLPVDFPPFQVQAFSGRHFLFSPAMEERDNDSLYKSKLWVSLRRLFGI